MEHPVIINEMTQDIDGFLGDNGKNVKFNILARIMEEVVATFQSVFKEDQSNGGIQNNPPLLEDEKHSKVKIK